MKTFTLEEAQSLLPVLDSLLNRAIDGKRAAEEIESALSELARRIYVSGGLRVNVADVATQRAEMEAHLERVRESLAEIDSIGVHVEDQVVLLCWKRGEPTIEHWHTVEAGFQGRQPLDERFRRRSTSGGRPN